ncbi:MAG: VRR-NUC domain-containing protein [Candidatus Riflebacteria bacterium]|nr:VRR-NUC domain-containing protein [Candidatus Riflebacteria bacterium]
MSEHELQQRILLELGNKPGIRIWRNNSGALYDQRGHLIKFGLQGSADILGIIKPHGRFLAIEVKAPRGKLTKQQERFKRMIEGHGGLYILARSMEDVKNITCS